MHGILARDSLWLRLLAGSYSEYRAKVAAALARRQCFSPSQAEPAKVRVTEGVIRFLNCRPLWHEGYYSGVYYIA